MELRYEPSIQDKIDQLVSAADKTKSIVIHLTNDEMGQLSKERGYKLSVPLRKLTTNSPDRRPCAINPWDIS